ncbi:unnamed protein product [Musa acuminata subsp. malaccensis]|uniref:(wild Malaysian banana) hypothetical protein n=1 Tax=Musa acuminata subsp. malaccensis TaxID=214687 RepID=A0A804KPL6_MUSAM|nr:unnamed protein product [Musa acuminata subsp. malaccensis]
MVCYSCVYTHSIVHVLQFAFRLTTQICYDPSHS